MTINRFDFIQYDNISIERQINFKNQFIKLANDIEEISTGNERASLLALVKLEECYMWIGKAIRDDQIRRI
jgi:hypothetical protein